jgi:alpha-maltose-1-phosphate synthase
MKVLMEGYFVDYEIQLANALSKSEEVTLIVPNRRLAEKYQEIQTNRVKLHMFESNRLNIIFKLISLVRRINPDIIHIQVQGGIDNFIVFVYYKLVKKRPVVATFHDVKLHLGTKSFFMTFVRYWIRKYANALIVHGERLRQQMIQEYNVSPDRVYVMNIGEHEVTPFKKYEQNDIKDDGKTILFFGRIYEYKGLKYLIEAEPIISKQIPGMKIIIAGTGENFKKYEDMIGERAGNYIIHNYLIPYKQGAEIFQRSSVVVLPYVEASQSGVVLTAYGFKKPVVITDVGSIPEIVDNNITGLIVPPKNPEKLAEAIIKLLNDENLRKQMGENAYTKLKTDLSFDTIAQKTINLYQDVNHKTR